VDVGILGGAITSFELQTDQRAFEKGREAVVAAVEDADIRPSAVGVAYVGSWYGSGGEGLGILTGLGMTGIPVINVENACASGSTALVEALRAVAHDDVDVALVVGVDVGQSPRSTGDESGSWMPSGLTPAALYALRARRYMESTGVAPEDIATVAVKNRRHGALNPIAVFRKPVELDEVMASPMIAEPLTRLQCCPVASGAAAVVVGKASPARKVPRLRAAALRSGTLQDRVGDEDTLTARTAAAAFEASGVGPADLDACELHDAFTIGEVLALEGIGVCSAGEAASYVRIGKADIGGGGTVVNPSGGLLSRGHPPGATGVAQVVEAADQILGRAGRRQVEGCRVVLCHTRGGSNADIEADACVVIVVSD
jgi:acetyl-CoA acetyltransferase